MLYLSHWLKKQYMIEGTWSFGNLAAILDKIENED